MYTLKTIILAFLILPALAMDEPLAKRQRKDTKAQIEQANQKLLEGAESRNIHAVDQALREGAQVDTTSPEGFAALHYSACNGDIQIAKLLIGAQANLNAQDKESYSPLHRAVKKGHVEIVRLLLKAGALVDTEDASHRTPLHLAATKGSFEIASLLMEYKANPNSADNDYYSPLHNALSNKHTDMVKLLLQAKPLLNLRDENGHRPLNIAVEKRDLASIQALIDAGADINAHTFDVNTPLYEAIDNDYTEIAQLLLMKGADYTLAGDRPFDEVYNPNSSEDSEGFLNNRTYSGSGFTCMQRAVLRNNSVLVKLLLAVGADATVKDQADRTALDHARESGNAQIVELLEEYNDLAQNVSLETGQKAVDLGYYALVQIMLKKMFITRVQLRTLAKRAQDAYAVSGNSMYEKINQLLKVEFFKQAKLSIVLNKATARDANGNAVVSPELPKEIADTIAVYAVQ
ncbi:ankyrin repeat domain-containing protein [Candidatus Dependentiae bacterium]|nr:ankyrin repeat domain-containing protein [Candidatus Dependentiae bacterium]